MTADDTSREALIEWVARVLDAEGAFCGGCDNEPGDFYDECSQCRRFLTGYATAVVDAVVMPLVRERDRLRYQADVSEHDRHLAWRAMDSARAEKGAAIKRAEAAEAAHKALTEAVQAALDGDSLVVCDVGVAAVPDDTLRAILTEYGAARIEEGEQG